jgi:hypothetical protein
VSDKPSPEENRRRIGWVMVLVAVLLAVRAYASYEDAERRAEEQTSTNRFVESMGDAPTGLLGDVEPDQAGNYALAGVSAVLFLGGCIIASSRD